MQYTQDIISNTKLKGKTELFTFRKIKIIKRHIRKIIENNYFELAIGTSILFLFIDYILIKEFILVISSL